MSNAGMMNPAFFVGRRILLDWINNTFQMNLSKIEETASGAVTCQILDALYPGEVPMSKVRWDAKSSHEYIDNYKIIQQVFEKKAIDKHIEVEKLMRGKYQDNLENMQWFKSFFDKNYAGQQYDGPARRLKGKGADSTPAFATTAAKRGPVASTAGGGETEENVAPAPTARPAKTSLGGGGGGAGTTKTSVATTTTSTTTTGAGSGGTSNTGSSSARASTSSSATGGKAAGGSGLGSSGVRANTASGGTTSNNSPGGGRGGGSTSSQVERQMRAKITELQQTNADLTISVESLEKERDFYFGKLRDIEILLQSYAGPDKPTVSSIMEILYATEPDFVAVDDNGAVIDEQNTSSGSQREVNESGDGDGEGITA